MYTKCGIYDYPNEYPAVWCLITVQLGTVDGEHQDHIFWHDIPVSYSI